MSITSPHFDEWKQKFLDTYAVWKTDSLPHRWEKRRIADSIEVVSTIDVLSGNSHSLVQNLLYACYQAAHAIDPDQDQTAIARREYKARLQALPKMIDGIDGLINYLEPNQDLGDSALRHWPLSQTATQELENSNAVQSTRTLISALRRLREGFLTMQTPDHPGLMNLAVDYAYGPLLFFPNDFEKDNIPNIVAKTRVFPGGGKINPIEVGLIFHLAYTFRFFTSVQPVAGCESVLVKRTGLDEDPLHELVLSGPMIYVGKPSWSLVAHFFNAVFKKAYPEARSQEEIADRLKYALCEAVEIQKHGDEYKKPLFGVHFYGWQTTVTK